MATLSALRTDLQKRVQDINGNLISAAPANVFINNALEEWQNHVEALTREYGFYVTGNQMYYPLPADHMKVKLLHWLQAGKYEIPYKPLKQFQVYGYFNRNRKATPPRAYTILDGNIIIGPAPGNSSNTTTINQGGGIGASDTTVTVTDPNKFQTPAGTIKIDSEQIQYYAVDATGTILQQLRRGTGGTTAATHANGATVQRLDLVMTYFYSAPQLVLDTDVPAIDARWHRMLVYHAVATALRMQGRGVDAERELKYFAVALEQAKREVWRLQRDTYMAVRNVY